MPGLSAKPRALWTRAHALAVSRDGGGKARRAAALALAIRLTSAGLAYVAQVVLARLMGQYEYGVFAYTWIWFLVFSAVATLGFGDSPVRYIAQLRARSEDAYLRGFIRFAGVAITLSSVASALAVAAAVPLFEGVIGPMYVLPMALMAISIPFACLNAYFEGVGRSYGWTLPALLPNYILRHGFLLLFMAGAVWLGFGASAATGFVCLVLTMLVSLAYQAATILMRLKRTVPPGPSAYRAREWLRGSAPFAVLYGAQHLASFADVLVLSFFVSPAEIAIYFAATRVIQVVNLIPYAATVGTAHLFSEAHTRGEQSELQRLCRNVASTTLSISAVALIAMALGGHWLLAMFGAGFSDGYAALVILAAGVFIRIAAGPAEDLLNMTGHNHISASTYMALVVVNVILAVVLVVPFGLVGAAVANAVATSARAVFLSAAAWRLTGVRTSILVMLARQAIGGRDAVRAPAE